MKKAELRSVEKVLAKEAISPSPVWLMRQAGRYLPEYREVRARAGSFWHMCMTPELAVEVTLQPIRRFGFDAAILFSDIMVVPYALGREVAFEEGVGPTLAPVDKTDVLDGDPSHWEEKLAPVYESLRQSRSLLDENTTLLGFAGAPWTLAAYMTAGRGSTDQKTARLWAYRDPQTFERLIHSIADCVAFHLIRQIEAGADAVQIFDSWAGGLPPDQFGRWVIAPTIHIVNNVRAAHPNARIIGFPRAATLEGYEQFARMTGVNAVSIDTAVPPKWAAGKLSPHVAVQGNLDPLALVAGGDALARGVDGILEAMDGAPLILNLGHGVLPETPPEHVAELVKRVRAAR